jgi:hypothetical protein
MDRVQEIDTLRRQISSTERHIERQREIIRLMQERGENTSLAEHVLKTFEVGLSEHRLYLARTLDEI